MQNENTRKYLKLLWVILPIVVIGFFVFGYTYLYKNIYNNVYLFEIDLSGKSYNESNNLITGISQNYFKDKVLSVYINDEEIDLNISKLGITIDTQKTLQNAYLYGRTGNVFDRMGSIIRALSEKVQIDVELEVNNEQFNEYIENFVGYVETPIKNPSYTIQDNILFIDTGAAGLSIDKDYVTSSIMSKIKMHDYTPIKLEVTTTNPEKVNFEQIKKEVDKSHKNAMADKENGGVLPHEIGLSLNIETANKILGDGSNKKYEIPLEISEPDITKEELEPLLFRDILSSVHSKVNVNDVNRTSNVKLSADLINGTILNPGEGFSYNDIVGKRSADRGFKKAKIYSEGEVVEGLGGGVCQTSSTIYMGLIRTNLQVKERKNHSLSISYVPMGEDCTVVYGQTDFKFLNSTPYPVKVMVKLNGNKLEVQFLGTKTDNKVIEIYTEFKDKIPFSVKNVADSSLPSGTTKVKQAGGNGYKTTTYKIIKEDGKEIAREKINSSVYKKIDKVINYGP